MTFFQGDNLGFSQGDKSLFTTHGVKYIKEFLLSK